MGRRVWRWVPHTLRDPTGMLHYGVSIPLLDLIEGIENGGKKNERSDEKNKGNGNKNALQILEERLFYGSGGLRSDAPM
jgi:hypothetical protein